MPDSDRDGCCHEGVLTESDARYYGLAGLGSVLVEDKVSQTVEYGHGVGVALRLHHMRMVAYDGIGTGGDERPGLVYLLGSGGGLELYAPV